VPLIGIALGSGAALVVGALIPLIGPLAFSPVVFVVAIAVVSLRALPPLNNVPAYFPGLNTFFAHLEPGILVISELAAFSGLGSFAAWIAHCRRKSCERRDRARPRHRRPGETPVFREFRSAPLAERPLPPGRAAFSPGQRKENLK
jgi:hypothetical protein